MKAFLIAIVAIAGLSAGAWAVLDGIGWTTSAKNRNADSVRLD